MPLKPLSYRQVKRKLEKAGFTVASQRGSHVKFVRYNSDGTQTTIVPYHRENFGGSAAKHFAPSRINAKRV